MSVRPLVSFTKNKQKKKAMADIILNHQIEPYTLSGELIMNSKVSEINVPFAKFTPMQRPDAASTVTSGV